MLLVRWFAFKFSFNKHSTHDHGYVPNRLKQWFNEHEKFRGISKCDISLHFAHVNNGLVDLHKYCIEILFWQKKIVRQIPCTSW